MRKDENRRVQTRSIGAFFTVWKIWKRTISSLSTKQLTISAADELTSGRNRQTGWFVNSSKLIVSYCFCICLAAIPSCKLFAANNSNRLLLQYAAMDSFMAQSASHLAISPRCPRPSTQAARICGSLSSHGSHRNCLHHSIRIC